MKRVALLLLILPLSGCVVSTAVHVATLPVRATGWTVDKLTTSQSESDRNRGRRERKAEERERKQQRKASREVERQERQSH